MDLFESNLVIGRLGITTETHAGSAMVKVEKTMENAASRTGISPTNSDESFQSFEPVESVACAWESRLGLIPDDFGALDLQCDSAVAVADAVEEDMGIGIGLLESFGITPPALHASDVDQTDEAMTRFRQEFSKPQPMLDEHASAKPSDDHHQPRSRNKKRKKATFRLPNETVINLKAYSKVTGQWQYSMVGEALESYFAKTSTELDVESKTALQ